VELLKTEESIQVLAVAELPIIKLPVQVAQVLLLLDMQFN
jgi:hypothetical protein